MVLTALLVAVALACAVLSLVFDHSLWLLAVSGAALIGAFVAAHTTRHRHP